ncbi:aspartate beta-hydroxylase domain-containing protein 2 isoform X2 [Corythoichthys intestinalis]|uniref:aspartate beta-hydroxylase domain-containing protein 2 isoform X2 n=1 Tax=Corythoichthys intestinalis TaxID=161448 RepID=UPI0025A5AB7D|nr:aspartate beta-hydroxylase domain-containing protein 2 isoform X2 [Corythoichthys intestinalis]
MYWSLDILPLPPIVELGVHSLSGLLWTLLLLFLWHCYRIGSDLPMAVHAHGAKMGSIRSARSLGGTWPRTKYKAQSKLYRSDQKKMFISMETEEDEEEQDYLTPVLRHAKFPSQASAQAKKLYSALQEYAKRYSWVGMGRIHKGLREQIKLNDHSTIQKPHLFFLPDVLSVPFFPRDAHRHDIEVLETNYPVILAEFQAVYKRGIDTKFGWTGMGSKGQAVFPLYSAGVYVAANCRSCPCTYRTLLSLRTFISSNSLGSAGFWLLGPGAALGSSYGPTNTRLRCHLGPPESGPRVILCVDVWHPNVAAAERQALDFMFSPDL